MKTGIVLSLLALMVSVRGLYADPIQDDLNKAIEQYREVVAQEKQKLIKRFDKAISQYTKKGNLESALRIKEMKEEFSENDVPEKGNGEKKDVKLTDLKIVSHKVGWGSLKIGEGATLPLINREACKDYIFAHADSLVRYEIPEGTKYFVAYGCTGLGADLRFIVKIDEKLVYKSRKLSSYRRKVVPIKIKIPKKARYIDLIADSMGDGDSDHSCWAFPRFTGDYE